MAVHTHIPIQRPQSRVRAEFELSARAHKVAIGMAAGVAGGVGMALPLVLYDWVNVGHSALELFMAPTAWLFGLQHFAQNGYLWWPIVVGAVVLIACWLLLGLLFDAIADRFALRSLPEVLGAGVAWGFACWLFFWYTLLPIARGGAPFHATAAATLLGAPVSTLFVAPVWVFVLAFALLGVATALTYRRLKQA